MKINIEDIVSLASTKLEKGFAYGLRLRPYSIGAQPKNPIQFIDKEDLPREILQKYKEPDYRYGVLVYKNKLNDRDVEHYSLTDMNAPSESEMWAKFKEFVEDMVEYEIEFDDFVNDFIKPRGELRERNPLHHLKPNEFFAMLQRNGYPGRLEGLKKLYNEI